MNSQVPKAFPRFRHPHPASTFLRPARYPVVLGINSGITDWIENAIWILTKSRVLHKWQTTTYLLIKKLCYHKPPSQLPCFRVQ